MYVRSAELYDQIYHFKDYAVACLELLKLLRSYRPHAKTLLDVACSTGRHLEHLQQNYEVQGLDINPKLLEIARRRCPGVPFHQANMIDFDIRMKFDVVTCLFSSIAYVKTVENLYLAIKSVSRHLIPGGLFLVEPWVSPEQFWADRVVTNFADSPERKVAWMYVSKLDGKVVTHDINFLVGTAIGVEHFTERHLMGLFDPDDYAAAMESAGLEILQFDPKGFFGNGLYVASSRQLA